MAPAKFTHGTLIKNLATGTTTCADCGLEVAIQMDLVSQPCVPRQAPAVTEDLEDEDPVQGLWRLENEARSRRTR